MLFQLNKRNKYRQATYSQCGEDVIIKFIFDHILKVKKPSYIDVGAYHPYILSNTALFSINGSVGMNIEPNPDRIHLFKKHRKNDITVNFGVSSEKKRMKYYCLEDESLNTFSEEIAKSSSNKISYTLEVEVDTLDSIIDKYWESAAEIDLLAIDVEGLNHDVLNSFNINKYRPKVICIETIINNYDNYWFKDVDAIQYLLDQGYLVHSDTCINTIFIDPYRLNFKLNTNR